MWVCVSVLYVCMFVCDDVYVTFKTSYKHKTRPRNNWCAPHRSAARGAFICLYSTLPTRLWISVKQMWTFQVRTKVSIYSSPKHENMNFLRQQCRPICESILIYTASYTENLHFFTNIKRLSLWWSNFWIASYNDFWTHHYGNILFVNSCNEETLIFFCMQRLDEISKKKFQREHTSIAQPWALRTNLILPNCRAYTPKLHLKLHLRLHLGLLCSTSRA